MGESENEGNLVNENNKGYNMVQNKSGETS